MGFAFGITLILVGVLGAANLIIARKPEAKEIIGKIAPYQGWIGVGAVFWGLWGITDSLLTIGWIASMPIFWFSYLVGSVLQVALGILLGVGVFKMFVKKPEAVEKLDLLVSKLAPKQGILGFVAIGTGMWMFVASIFFVASVTDYADDLDDWADAAAAQQAAAAAAAAAAAGQMQMPGQVPGQVPVQVPVPGQVPVAAPVAPVAPVAPAAPAAAGIPARAMVQQSWQAGVDPASQQPLMGMDLYITPTAGAPYQVRVPSVPVPAAKQALVAPQAWIQVTIDPANPQNVTPVL